MKLKSIIALGLVATSLQGCFPLVATGVVTGALAIADRRSVGVQTEDETIEWKAESRVSKRYPAAHVNVVSYNRRALITGEVPNQVAVDEIGQIVAGVENVANVVNELQIGGVSTLSSRANDGYLTSRVKGRFVDAAKFPANRVKVFTEAGRVYLMGVVTQAEASAAIEVARTTSGVQRVVNVLEVISDSEAKRIDAAPGASVNSGKGGK